MKKLPVSILALVALFHAAVSTANAQQPLSEILVGKTFVNAVPAGFWIGRDRGFFKKYGIEVKIIQFTGNTIGTQALLGGSIPFLMAGPHSSLAARAGGADLVEIATLSPAMPYLMIAGKEIKSPEGLKGKIVGVAGVGLTGSYIAALIGLRNLGLDPKRDKITLIATGTETERLAALSRGRIDATVIDQAYKPVIEREGYSILADLGARGVPWEHDVLLTTGQVLKGNSDLAERLLKGLLEANAFILNPANKEIVKKILVKELGEKMGDGSVAYDQLVSLWIKARPYANRKGLQSIIEEIKVINPAVANVKIDEFVNDAILRKLDQSRFIDSLYKK
jgi:ABC-type nitrate/sulfonate/bicarbonate transport system substrate-binding protein